MRNRVPVTVGLLFGLVASPGCESPEDDGVLYQESVLPAVDMHLHTGEWSLIPPATQEYLARNFPFPFSLDPGVLAYSALSAKGLVKELDRAGLDKGVVYAVYAPNSVGVATNEHVIKQLEAAPDRLWGFASLRVDRWQEESEKQLAALEAALEHPQMIGIKIAHAHMHFRMDDPDYYGIYEVAEKTQAPVYLHTGPSPFPGTMAAPPYTDAAYLEDAIAAYPNVVFILGHVGYDFINRTLGTLETCLSLAKTYENVYLEASALGSHGSDSGENDYQTVLQRVREEGLVDRLLYGSDGPQFPGFLQGYAERTVTAMDLANYSTEEAQKVFNDNFYWLFGSKL